METRDSNIAQIEMCLRLKEVREGKGTSVSYLPMKEKGNILVYWKVLLLCFGGVVVQTP